MLMKIYFFFIIDKLTPEEASLWFSCPTKFGIKVVLYPIPWHIGTEIFSHLDCDKHPTPFKNRITIKIQNLHIDPVISTDFPKINSEN